MFSRLLREPLGGFIIQTTVAVLPFFRKHAKENLQFLSLSKKKEDKIQVYL